uniref:NADH dehydrogenase subunit 4L n=1 Tax=Holarthrothrips indicus TaxID=1965675 RepID=A0A8A5L783_9NEOP|nr:NADH dehydrogenase subunit 4L [Holarthrothrips indicus]
MMMNISVLEMNMFCLFMFMMSAFSLILSFSSFLNSLIILESIVLSIYFLMSIYLISSFESYFLMYMLVLAVCEGTLGLSIFIKGMRVSGVSNYKYLNLF